MKEIMNVETVEQYNRLFDLETRHPQVGVVNFDTVESQRDYRMTIGFYSLFLKETVSCTINYGKTKYDFDDWTVVSVAPGQTIGYTTLEGIPSKAKGLLFHPDFIHGTSLGQKIKRYSFFSYESNEALHLSLEERVIVQNCLSTIATELSRPIDKHTKGLICTNIELLLDYCLRFYERQFITRRDVNVDSLTRFERLIDDYLHSGQAVELGVPSVKYFADKIHLSPNYFGDLVKSETGKSPKELIQLKMIDLAKEHLYNPDKSITEIGYAIGFQYPQHFVRFFKKYAGVTPSQFRQGS